MSEVSEGSGPVHVGPRASSDGGAPVSGALAIVLAVVAVVAGFFILRSISDDGDKQFDLQSADDGGTGGDDEHRRDLDARRRRPRRRPCHTSPPPHRRPTAPQWSSPTPTASAARRRR